MRTVLRCTLPVLAFLLLISTRSMAETAAETYKTTCAMCHGTDGKGDTALGKNLHAKDLTHSGGRGCYEAAVSHVRYAQSSVLAFRRG